jgi:hypothetical protein
VLLTDTSASYAAYLGRIGFGTARQHCMGSPMSSIFDREHDQQEVCGKSRSTAAVPVSMPVPVDRECEEVRRDEASGGEGCDTMPSGVPVGVTSRAPRRWPTFTSPTVFENWPVPTPTDSTSWTGSWTDRPDWTVLTGRELAAETVSSGSSYRLPAALRPAHGLRTDTFGVLSCVAQLGARGCTDRSLARSRECYWHAGATVLRTGPVGRCGSADFSAGKYGGHAMATNPAWDWAGHTQARPRYTEPGHVRRVLCARVFA